MARYARPLLGFLPLALVFLVGALATIPPALADSPDAGTPPAVEVAIDPATDLPVGTLDPAADADAFVAFAMLAIREVHAPHAGSRWPLVAVLALIVIVSVFRRFGSERFPFLTSGPGSAIVVLALGALTPIALGLIAGVAFAWPLVLSGLAIGFKAAGGFSAFIQLAPWALEHLPVSPWTAPLTIPIRVALAVVDKSTAAEAKAAREAAKAAGDKGVSASPPGGVSGILGAPSER